jgi:hypothetical protein
MPLVTAGRAPVFVALTNQLRAVLSPAFDPQTRVFLPPEAQGVVTAAGEPGAKVGAVTVRNQAVEFETDSPAPALVVLAQTWSPHWRAFVDGQPVALWRANHAFQALQVPAGVHRVRVVYRDSGFLLGAVISGLCTAGCVPWIRLARRRPPGSAPAA